MSSGRDFYSEFLVCVYLERCRNDWDNAYTINVNKRVIYSYHLWISPSWVRASHYIPIYIQQDATLHSLFISGNCSKCFGCYFHPSSGAHTTVSTASGICHPPAATCRLARPCNPNIFQYISNKIQLYTVYLYLETALHVSGVTSPHHQERIQLYLQHLVFVIPLLLPAAIAAGTSNGLTNTRCSRYSCMCSWWWVKVPPETCRAVSKFK
jgi:hypothetical protein